ncbi:MAG: hypothetical protein OEV22_21635 [Deltaproteobacteria bacterium]|nr:hypothetical protein [Deltaproteobacteria bacterium]
MAFTQSTFAPVSAHAANSPSVYSYNTSDNLEDVLQVGYFADKRFQLEELDLIEITTPQGTITTQVGSDTSTVDVQQSAIVGISSGGASSDFNDPSWERSTGLFSLSEIGAAYSNAPFRVTQPTEVYEVIVRTEKGSGSITQYMTVVDPEGIEQQFLRAGSPESSVLSGGWSIVFGGLTDKGAVITTDATQANILTYQTEANKDYAIEFLVSANSGAAGGAFAGRYFMLLRNIAGTVDIVAGLETIYRKRTTGGIGVFASASGSDVTVKVLGKTSQTWQWHITTMTYEIG